MSSTWVPCAPLDERVSRAGPYPRARYGSGCFSAALISSGVYSRPYPKRALRRGHATLVPDGKQARPARGGHEVAVGEVAAVIDDADHDTAPAVAQRRSGQEIGTGAGFLNTGRQGRPERTGRLEAFRERELTDRLDTGGRDPTRDDRRPIRLVGIADVRASTDFACSGPRLWVGHLRDDGDFVDLAGGSRREADAAAALGQDPLESWVHGDRDLRPSETFDAG